MYKESGKQNIIAVEQTFCYSYPGAETKFRPSTRYPEYPFQDFISETENPVYDAVRNCFIRLGYDKEHYGTKEWNPLGQLIRPGQNVFIKPNFVEDQNANKSGGVECLYTQPGVIAAVLDYVVIALGETAKEGHIVLGDAPMQECDFERLVSTSGIDVLVDFYRSQGVQIKLVDCRAIVTTKQHGLMTFHNQEVKSHIINLGNHSEFSVLNNNQCKRLRKGANGVDDLFTHHHEGTHEYNICDELLNCDVLINMPKPKTHRKAGVTISLKNMIGVNSHKEYLPHHTEGDKETGLGDAYRGKSALKKMRAFARDNTYSESMHKHFLRARIYLHLRQFFALCILLSGKDRTGEGMWSGNETLSKTILDINKIVAYADKNGNLCDTPQRKQFIVADMIVSGEKDGPLAPSPKNVGIIAMGENCPVCFDECIATLMGADVSKIPTLRDVRRIQKNYNFVSFEGVGVISSNNPQWDGKQWNDISKEQTLKFIPHEGWKEAFYC